MSWDAQEKAHVKVIMHNTYETLQTISKSLAHIATTLELIQKHNNMDCKVAEPEQIEKLNSFEGLQKDLIAETNGDLQIKLQKQLKVQKEKE